MSAPAEQSYDEVEDVQVLADSEEEEYEEEEVEVEEDEAEVDEVEAEPKPEPKPEPLKKPVEPTTPSKKATKVKASPSVRDMEMKSPEAVAKTAGPTLSPSKNPFPAFGAWTPKTLSEVEIAVPVLTGKNESTNELTRDTKPEARYWKSPILFKYGNFSSSTIRFDNVHIPHHTGKNYGSNFVYLCLPGFAADNFANAGKTRRPTRVTEKSLAPDNNRWWKVANNISESFGIISNDTKKFHKKSLETLFEATGSGITATVVLSFLFKASTEGKEPLKPTTMGTVSVVLERGYITATDINVQMPTRISNRQSKVEPSATSKDVATDSLTARLAEIGM